MHIPKEVRLQIIGIAVEDTISASLNIRPYATRPKVPRLFLVNRQLLEETQELLPLRARVIWHLGLLSTAYIPWATQQILQRCRHLTIIFSSRGGKTRSLRDFEQLFVNEHQVGNEHQDGIVSRCASITVASGDYHWVDTRFEQTSWLARCIQKIDGTRFIGSGGFSFDPVRDTHCWTKTDFCRECIRPETLFVPVMQGMICNWCGATTCEGCKESFDADFGPRCIPRKTKVRDKDWQGWGKLNKAAGIFTHANASGSGEIEQGLRII